MNAAPSPGELLPSDAGAVDGGSGDAIHTSEPAPDAATSQVKCGEWVVPSTVVPGSGHGNVLIVFDQSESMTTDFAGRPLWKAASDAVRDAIAPLADSLTAAAIFFPTSSGGSGLLCTPDNVADVDTPPQISFRDGTRFLNAWDARFRAPGLVLGTPTSVAMAKAAEALDGATLDGPTAVLLVTDGASTCLLSDTSAETAAQLLKQGTSSYVIGLPGSGSAANALNAIATAGGTHNYLTPDDPAALTQALLGIFDAVVRSTIGCEIRFDALPDRLTDMALIVTDAANGQRFRVERGADGWEASSDGRGATLLGSTCAASQAGRFSDVSFEFGCGDVLLR